MRLSYIVSIVPSRVFNMYYITKYIGNGYYDSLSRIYQCSLYIVM